MPLYIVFLRPDEQTPARYVKAYYVSKPIVLERMYPDTSKYRIQRVDPEEITEEQGERILVMYEEENKLRKALIQAQVDLKKYQDQMRAVGMRLG